MTSTTVAPQGTETAERGGARARRDAFFDTDMTMVEVTGWPDHLVRPSEPIRQWVRAPDGARLRLAAISAGDARHLPPTDSAQLDTAGFALRHSGNRTLSAPKRSWKVDLEVGEDRIAGMETLNLKSMYNDASQMRESLAWNAFRVAGVVASRHSYARLGINGRYLGLFALIEQVDRSFLRSHFPGPVRGNLYKMYCGSLGPATLEHRVGPDGDDSGRQYISPDPADQTYRLVGSWSDHPGAETYDDLAHLVRVVDASGIPGGPERFDTDAYADAVTGVFDVQAFLRWAAVNVLAGSWDNYFATPANYYLYNHGRPGGSPVDDPYFTFIPWDYDNSFGIDYFGVSWQYTDLLDWPASTGPYWRFNGSNSDKRTAIPLMQNVLRNTELRRSYLDTLEMLLADTFAPAKVDAMIGLDGGGLWQRVATGAYLESDTPHGQPFTGRQYTNDEVYQNAHRQHELRHGDTFVLGIHHYLRMRHDRARQQLAAARRAETGGVGGAGGTGPA